VLRQLTPLSPSIPQVGWEGVRVKFVHHQVERLEQAGLMDLAREMSTQGYVGTSELVAHPGRFLMCVRGSYGVTKLIDRVGHEHVVLVWSMWRGYWDRNRDLNSWATAPTSSRISSTVAVTRGQKISIAWRRRLGQGRRCGSTPTAKCPARRYKAQKLAGLRRDDLGVLGVGTRPSAPGCTAPLRSCSGQFPPCERACETALLPGRSRADEREIVVEKAELAVVTSVVPMHPRRDGVQVNVRPFAFGTGAMQR
jgi:hypothetical protein